MGAGGLAIASLMFGACILSLCLTPSTVHAAVGSSEPSVRARNRAGKASHLSDNQAHGSVKRLILRDPRENLQAKPLRAGVDEKSNFARNTEDQLNMFLKAFGHGYRTRFPPEPNGYLHIGHAKAMLFNFGQAAMARNLGFHAETILRFDDTNPAAEEQEYIDAILDSVKWLGHSPVKVTYTSDYFQELYDCAVKLIQDGNAYICHQTFEDMRKCRSLNREARLKNLPVPAEALSPWRETDIQVNLEKFEKMRAGDYKEGDAVLRMKGNFSCDNPAMWDPVLYRIKFDPPHPRTGSAWCIYPSYDMSHCIVDSIEGITHSCCTTEFSSRQAADGPYYWLLHVLGMYKPVTFEYSRCSMANNVLSKRKLQRLVQSGLVDGWDDPRLLTLSGLRRRGYPPEVINRFCEQLGMSISQNVVTQPHMLEAIAREHFDLVAPRVFAVLRPLRVTIKNFLEAARAVEDPSFRVEGTTCYSFHQWFPKNASLGGRQISMSDCIYIDRNDFQEEAATDFFGLTAGRSVGLIGSPFLFTCEEVVKDGNNQVCSLSGRIDVRHGQPKPKGHLHWLDGREGAAVVVLVRCFGPLLQEDSSLSQPSRATEEGDEGQVVSDDWLKSLNDRSVVENPGAMLEKAAESMEGPMQFMREGYFCRDVRGGEKAYHEIVGLKSSKG